MKKQNFSMRFIIGMLSLVLLLSFTVFCGGKAVASETKLEKKYEVLLFQKFIIDPKLETDYPGVVSECEKSTISDLQAKNMFRKVERAGEGAVNDEQTLLVQQKLLTLRIVSGAARFWGGAFAGQSEIIVELKMTDAASGKIVHEKVLSTANNPFAAAWTFGGNDRTLPTDMGKIISEYIVSIMPAK